MGDTSTLNKTSCLRFFSTIPNFLKQFPGSKRESRRWRHLTINSCGFQKRLKCYLQPLLLCVILSESPLNPDHQGKPLKPHGQAALLPLGPVRLCVAESFLPLTARAQRPGCLLWPEGIFVQDPFGPCR